MWSRGGAYLSGLAFSFCARGCVGGWFAWYFLFSGLVVLLWEVLSLIVFGVLGLSWYIGLFCVRGKKTSEACQLKEKYQGPQETRD